MSGSGRAGAVLRLSRAAVLAGAAVAVTGSAHVLGGGHAPGPVGALLLTAALVLPAARLLDRPASALRVLALLGAGQVTAHLLWTAQAAGPSGGVPVATAGHHGAAHAPVTVPTGHGPGWLDLDARMVAVHLGATALLALWLAAGERRLWELLRLLAVELAAAARIAVPAVRVPRPRPTTACAAAPLLPQLLSSLSVARRGPPALA